MRTGGGDAGAGAAAASRASAAATASALDATFFGLLRGDCGEAGGSLGTVASHWWPASGGARSSTMTKPCSMSYFKSLRAAHIARYCPAVVAVVHRSKFSLRRLRVRELAFGTETPNATLPFTTMEKITHEMVASLAVLRTASSTLAPFEGLGALQVINTDLGMLNVRSRVAKCEGLTPSISMDIRASLPSFISAPCVEIHQRRLLQDPFLLGLNGSAGGGMSGLRDGLSHRTSKSGGRYGITPTMAVALESAEHEERRDAQLYGFIQRFRTEKERLGNMASLQRVRTTARLCLHALRSHAAERVAWRGTKYGVALTAIMGNRTIVWTAFIAWRMDTRREAEKRHQTQEVVNVVQQRLLAAEGHFESLVDAQVRKRLSLRDKYVATRRHLWRERLLRICWLALRMWSYNQRMLDERQAWRDLFHNIKAGAAAAIKVVP